VAVANASAAVVESLKDHVSVVEDQAEVSIVSCRVRGVSPPSCRGDDDRDGDAHVVDSNAVDADEDAGGDDVSVEEDVGGGGGGLTNPCSSSAP
jgi:hypothetical protein